MRKSVIFLAACVWIACAEILVKDISKDTIVLRAPTNGYATTPQREITLWWDGIDGATQFELLIVSPNIDSTNWLVMDSVLTSNQLTVRLDSGKFQWCVRALNTDYHTSYECRDLHISP